MPHAQGAAERGVSCAVVGSETRKPKASTHRNNLVEARLNQRRCAVGRRLMTSCTCSHRCAQRRRWKRGTQATRLSAPTLRETRAAAAGRAHTLRAGAGSGTRTWQPPRAGLLGRPLDSDFETGRMQVSEERGP